MSIISALQLVNEGQNMADKKNAEENKERVVIGVPVSDTDAMRALTCQSIGGCIIGAGGLVIDMILRRSCDIVSNRTWLVNEAIKNGGTHILFVDSDMIFPDDTIKRLLAHKKEIVGVRYKKREFPVKWLYEPLGEESETEIFKVKYTGMGLMLIDLSIFTSKLRPLGVGADGRRTAWFNFGRNSEGALVMGEDVWFANVARDSGYDVWVDGSIKVGHCGEYIF